MRAFISSKNKTFTRRVFLKSAFRKREGRGYIWHVFPSCADISSRFSIKYLTSSFETFCAPLPSFEHFQSFPTVLADFPSAPRNSHFQLICLKTQQPQSHQSKPVAAQDKAIFWSPFANTSLATGSSHTPAPDSFLAHHSHNPRQVIGEAAKAGTGHLPSGTRLARHPSSNPIRDPARCHRSLAV